MALVVGAVACVGRSTEPAGARSAALKVPPSVDSIERVPGTTTAHVFGRNLWTGDGYVHFTDTNGTVTDEDAWTTDGGTTIEFVPGGYYIAGTDLHEIAGPQPFTAQVVNGNGRSNVWTFP